MKERYSIEVDDETVEIYGELTIEEAFDFLSFFERKGYKSVIIGSENSTLRMIKRDKEELILDQRLTCFKDEIDHYKSVFKYEQNRHEETKEKLKSLELLLKDLMSEEHDKYKKLYEEHVKLQRNQSISNLEVSPNIQKMLDEFNEEFNSENKQI